MLEEEKTTRQSNLWAMGILYGAVLTVIGFLAANAGHGTYVLMGIFSAPFGLLGIPGAIIGAMILWLLIGLLLGGRNSSSKKFFLLMILVHYAGIILLLNTETFGDWKYFEQAIENNATTIFLGLAIYVVGQLFIWLRFAMAVTEKTEEAVT
jgi:hypothetical protein